MDNNKKLVKKAQPSLIQGSLALFFGALFMGVAGGMLGASKQGIFGPGFWVCAVIAAIFIIHGLLRLNKHVEILLGEKERESNTMRAQSTQF